MQMFCVNYSTSQRRIQIPVKHLKFKMKTIGDYHDLYLKTDVLLLADVFEKLIGMCLEYYWLDTCHYFSSSGLGWLKAVNYFR